MRNRLLIFGRFTHDAQRILAAIGWLAFVGIERGLNGLFGSGLELRIAVFAHTDYRRVAFHHSQSSFPHEMSLAYVGTGTESL